MVNNKYATTWTYYNGQSPWISTYDSQLSLRNIAHALFFSLASEVTTELVNTIAEHESALTIHYYYQVTPIPIMLLHTSWIKRSNKKME
jgi:hypothetical protein